MIGGGRPFLRENLVDAPKPPIAKRRFSARSSSAVRHSKKVQLTLTGSPLGAFQLA